MPRAGLSRRAVVDLALAVVDDGGPDGFAELTLAAVAGRAGVAVPSLYKHVGGLPDLRREVAVRALEEFGEHVLAAVAESTGGAAIRAVGHAVRDYARRHPGRYAAVQAAPTLGGDGRLEAAATAAVRVLASALGPGEPTGADDDAVHVVRAVRAAVHGFVDLELRGGFGMPQDRDASFARLLDVLAAGLGVP